MQTAVQGPQGGAVAPYAAPLVYTSRGNLPAADLSFSTSWIVHDDFIQFTETYRDAQGEVVRQDVHVYDRKGISATAVAANF